MRAVWSSKMPLACTPSILNLLDGLVGIDPAFHNIWARFRMMRRYLAYCRRNLGFFRMLDLISREAQGRGPVHLPLTSASELGFAWDGEERGWVRVSLPPLRMMTGPIQHFYASMFDDWRYSVFAKLSERKVFFGAEYVVFEGSLQLLTSSHLRERDNILLRAILCGGQSWNGFLLGKAKKEDVPCRFCGKRDGDGHLFWECAFPLFPLLHVRDLPEFSTLMALDRSNWPRCLLWHGWLPGLSCAGDSDPWVTSLGIWLAASLSVVRVLILRILLLFGPRLIFGMLMILLWKCLILLISGRMVVGKTSLRLVGLRWLVLVFMYLLLSLLLRVRFGRVAEEYGVARLERCRAFMSVPGPDCSAC